MKKIIIGILTAFLILVSASAVMAKDCHSVYGGGEVCEYGDISIDKQVLNPNKNEYWDNIDSSDYVFGANQEITFKVAVKNTSDIKIDSLSIRDYMTDYLSIVSSSNTYNWIADEKKAEWGFVDLEPGETETVYIKFKVFDKDYIPSGITCLTNKADVEKDNGNRKSDSSSFCIAKETTYPRILGATMPDTGVNLPMILGLELLALGGLGIGYVVVGKKLYK